MSVIMATVKEGDHMTREKDEIIERLDNLNWYNVSIETLRFIYCVLEMDEIPDEPEISEEPVIYRDQKFQVKDNKLYMNNVKVYPDYEHYVKLDRRYTQLSSFLTEQYNYYINLWLNNGKFCFYEDLSEKRKEFVRLSSFFGLDSWTGYVKYNDQYCPTSLFERFYQIRA